MDPPEVNFDLCDLAEIQWSFLWIDDVLLNNSSSAVA
jgi:hypothetical protein